MTKYIYDRNRCYMASTERLDAVRNCTEIEPPETKDGEIAVFSGTNWIVMEDNRRKLMYNVHTAEEQRVTQPGPIPDGWSLNEDDVDPDAVKDREIKKEAVKAENMISDVYPIEYQIKVATGVIEDEDMLNFIADVEKRKNRNIDEIKKGGKIKQLYPEKPNVDLTPGLNGKLSSVKRTIK